MSERACPSAGVAALGSCAAISGDPCDCAASPVPSISIIIPVLNEEAVIEGLLAQLRPLNAQCEIIFADGGSTDRTLELIGDEFRIVCAPRGRGRQLNAGAQASSGEVLFFLHADSELPPDPLGEIHRVMRSYQVGCFGVAFRSRNFFMLTCRIMSNLRCYVRRIMFGDQGIFVTRELFFQMGGFPDLPLMEDYQFSLNLRARGCRIGATRHRIYSSPRRFGPTTSSKLRTMYHMAHLRKLYRKGVSAHDLVRAYADVR